jgi:hypothetical protein
MTGVGNRLGPYFKMEKREINITKKEQKPIKKRNRKPKGKKILVWSIYPEKKEVFHGMNDTI